MIRVDISYQEGYWVSFTLSNPVILCCLSDCISCPLDPTLCKSFFKVFIDDRLWINDIRLCHLEFIISDHLILFLHVHDKWMRLSKNDWELILSHVLCLHEVQPGEVEKHIDGFINFHIHLGQASLEPKLHYVGPLVYIDTWCKVTVNNMSCPVCTFLVYFVDYDPYLAALLFDLVINRQAFALIELFLKLCDPLDLRQSFYSCEKLLKLVTETTFPLRD